MAYDALTTDQLNQILLTLGQQSSVPTLFVPIRPIITPANPFPVAGINPTAAIKNPITPGTPKSIPIPNSSGVAGTPFPLLTLAVVQTPVHQQTYTSSNLTITFTRNYQDKNFDHVDVWVAGYHGQSNPRLIASGTVSPMNVLLDATDETVTVYAQTVGSTGLAAAVLYAIKATVILSGAVGAPPAPTISQTLVGTPMGFQFGFNQVILPSGDQEVIYSYNIYRAVVNTFASATLHATIVPNPGLTGAITYTDTINGSDGSFYFYWVTAVNTAGFESTATPAQSGAVVGSTGSLPANISTPFIIIPTNTTVTINTSPSCHFTRADGTMTLIGQTTTPITGLTQGDNIWVFPYWDEVAQDLAFVDNTDCAIPNITSIKCSASSSQYVETSTGAVGTTAYPNFSVEMWVQGTVAGALFDYSSPQVIGTIIASQTQCQVTSAGEVKFGGSSSSITTAGANVLDGRWHHIVATLSGTTGKVYVDGQNTSDNTNFWTGTIGGLSSVTGYWHFGVVAGGTGFPVTSTLYNSFYISHIAVYTRALSVVQITGHQQAFANLGESYYNQEVSYDSAQSFWKLTEASGTTAADSIDSNTGTYKATPALNQTSPVVSVIGSPAIAFPYNYTKAVQQQFLRNHAPLSSSGIEIPVKTANIQSVGGSGGYQGAVGGGCFSGNVKVKTANAMYVSFNRLPKVVWIQNETGLHLADVLTHEGDWEMIDMGGGQLVTPDHLLRAGDWVPASVRYAGILKRTKHVGKVYNLHIRSDKPEDQHFILSNGVIAHNMKNQFIN